MSRLSGATKSLAVLTLCTSLAAVNCSKGSSDSKAGDLRIGFLANGFNITSASYQVLSSTGTVLAPLPPQTGTFDVSDPNATVSLDIELPPSTNDTIVLTATSSTGQTFTGTGGPFNITSGGVTVLPTITLSNTTTPPVQPGQVQVSGNVVPSDNPPVITFALVAPAQTSVGASIGVTVTATDADAGDVLSYLWTAPSGGTFASPTSPTTTFSSTTPGTQSLTITVTDSHGASTSISLPVTIIGTTGAAGAGGGSAGAGGTAGSAGTGGTAGSAGIGGPDAGTGGTAGGAGTSGPDAGTGGTAGSGGSAPLVLGLFDQDAYFAAATWETDGDAVNANVPVEDEPTCGLSNLSANAGPNAGIPYSTDTSIDAFGLSWGFLTLATPAEQLASAQLFKGFIDALGTPAPVNNTGAGAAFFGWPDGTTPRPTGVGTNATNTGAGPNVHLGGLGGLNVTPAAILGGSINGELASLFKAAAIADGLIAASTGLPLTSTSSNADFGGAIAPVTSNPNTAVGLASNLAHCAIAVQIATGTSNPVEALQ